MKTFKQWFNSLSEETQKYLKETCKWIDTTTKDYYTHPTFGRNFVESSVAKITERLETDSWRHDSDLDAAFFYFLKTNRATLSEDEYNKLMYGLIDCNSTIRDNAVDIEDLRTYARLYYQKKELYNKRMGRDRKVLKELADVLLLTEDFSNIDWSEIDKGDLPMTGPIMEILGHDEVIKLAKENPGRLNLRYRNERGGMNNPVFDELFFCENGWTPEQKRSVLDRYGYNEDDVRDFMERIVAVDESYLRFVGTYFISNNPALGMHLYKEKKPADELNALPAGHKIEDEYRYPKEYRKLFQIAACCARENVGKAMAGTLGTASGILKMYGYNFNMIFDCLYPQYAEEQTTEAETV